MTNNTPAPPAAYDADIASRLQNEADLCRNDGADDIALLLDAARERITALEEAVKQADQLLHTALDLFDGNAELCDEPPSEEWAWKHQVQEYFFDRIGTSTAALAPQPQDGPR